MPVDTYAVSEEHVGRLIPVKEIFVDETFNCRRPFTPASVEEFSKEIAATKLKYPVTVQPASDVLYGLPVGFNFRLIAGFRRYAAVSLLRYEFIPAFIEHGLSEDDAKLYNFKENIERRNLTLYEEALGLRKMFPKGTDVTSIAKALTRSVSWVRPRLVLLDMPEQIRREADGGELTQTDIAKLARLPPDGQLDFFLKMQADKELYRKETGKRLASSKMEPKRVRSRKEIEQKILDIGEIFGDGPWTFVLSWAAGHLSDDELDDALDKWGCNG
jgi:ParB family chromosome partitioning protein